MSLAIPKVSQSSYATGNQQSVIPSGKKKKGQCDADRFIPSRSAGTGESFEIHPPQKLYEQTLVQQLFPSYSKRTLRYSLPSEYALPKSPKLPKSNPQLRWTFPQKSERTLHGDGVLSDFYTHNVDWGSQLLAFNLGKVCYCWNRADEEEAIELPPHQNYLSCVKWSPSSELLACGDQDSCVRIYDMCTEEMIFTRELVKINTLFERSIYALDFRSENEFTTGLFNWICHSDQRVAHSLFLPMPNAGKVCAVVWNDNQTQFACGMNGNRVSIFDVRKWSDGPVDCYTHKAAIKALQWVKDRSHLLLSGGGNGDRKIKLYDVEKQTELSCGAAGSQITDICSIDESYFAVGLGSGLNNVQFWRYQSNTQQLQYLTSVNKQRGKILGMSLDGDSISPELCTLSSNSTLCFWRLKNNERSRSKGVFGEFVSTIR